MITALHILIALISIGHITYTFTRPTKKQLYVSYGTVALTLMSGILLAVVTPSHMMQACTSGLVYLSVMSVAIIATNVKLAHIKSINL